VRITGPRFNDTAKAFTFLGRAFMIVDLVDVFGQYPYQDEITAGPSLRRSRPQILRRGKKKTLIAGRAQSTPKQLCDCLGSLVMRGACHVASLAGLV